MKRQKEEIKQLKNALRNAKAAARQAKSAVKAAEKAEQRADAIVQAIEQSIEAIANRPATEGVAAPKKRGRKPGRPKSSAAKKPGRPAKATTGRRGRPPKVVKTGDDLTRIKGVGDKVAEMLIENGVGTFRAMASLSVDQFKELLRENNMSKFRNPSNWAAEAAVLADEPVDESADAAPQKKRRGRPPVKKAAAKKTAAKKTTGRRGRPPKAKAESQESAKTKKAPTRRGRSPKAKAGKATAAKKTTGRRGRPPQKPKQTDGDDLTQVKGVGDKVAEMLKQNGVSTFKAMSQLSVEEYKELLRANNMSKFRNPTKWAAQAEALAKADN